MHRPSFKMDLEGLGSEDEFEDAGPEEPENENEEDEETGPEGQEPENVNALHWALMHIGFSHLAANEVMEQGLQDTPDFLSLTSNDVKTMCKIIRDGGVIIPFMAQ